MECKSLPTPRPGAFACRPEGQWHPAACRREVLRWLFGERTRSAFRAALTMDRVWVGREDPRKRNRNDVPLGRSRQSERGGGGTRFLLRRVRGEELVTQKASKIRDVEGLGREANGAAVGQQDLALAEGIGAHENDPSIREPLPDYPCELDAVRSGHHEIRDHEIKGLAGHRIERSPRVRCG